MNTNTKFSEDVIPLSDLKVNPGRVVNQVDGTHVVIDTNVLVSAALKDRDPEAVILFVAGRDDMEWIVSPEIMSEYREVLSRAKFGKEGGMWRENSSARLAPLIPVL